MLAAVPYASSFALLVSSGLLLREFYLALTVNKLQVENPAIDLFCEIFMTTTREIVTSSYLRASYPPKSARAHVSLS